MWSWRCSGLAASEGALAADTPECPLNRLATVKIVALRDGRIKVPVTLEGHPLSFLVDTGGVITTVKWDQARQMGLPVKQNIRQLVGVGGSMLNFSVTGENFLVGDLRVKNRPICGTAPAAGRRWHARRGYIAGL